VWLGNCVRQCTWRDTAVLVEGGGAAHAAEEFDQLWQDAFALTWRRRTAQPLPSPPPIATGDVPVRVLADEPGRRCTEQALVAAIAAAQLEVLVTNQYAVPTPGLTEALIAAARRGVDIQLMVPAASHPFFVGFATEHRLGRLLEAGVAVWHWNGVMMHAKTVVIDRRCSLVGSTNLDWLSLRGTPRSISKSTALVWASRWRRCSPSIGRTARRSPCTSGTPGPHSAES